MRLCCLVLILCVATSAVDAATKREEAEKKIRAAVTAARKDDLKTAAKLAGEAIKADPKFSFAYYFRGRQLFQLSKFRQSLEDFNKYVKLSPNKAPSQWERGITCYYAREFQEGAKQFKLYQTYHDNDVENSVWRYLCMVPTEGVEKSRKTMLPIRNDRRVPMMEIFDMFRGKKTVEDVLAATKRGDPGKEVLGGRMFYARLYIGLYYESLGKHKLAEKYLRLAADKHKGSQRINQYMWAVARAHVDNLDRLKKEEKGFKSLFSGKDLSNWVVMGKKAGWKVSKGMIHSDAGLGGNWLRSKVPYKNFILRVEWRVSKGGNSGVFVRSTKSGNPWVTGYEVQISNNNRDLLHCTGSLYGFAPVKKRPDESAGRWHEFEIHCQGSRLIVKCDGVTSVDFDQSSTAKTKKKPIEGFIGLQDAHAGKGNTIEYRNIRIKALK